MNIHVLLDAKDKEHGNVNDVSDAVCGMWDIFYGSNNCAAMTHIERMCMHMIMMKLARAMSGGRLKDHWLDIAGYAQLVVDEIERNSRPNEGGYGEQGL